MKRNLFEGGCIGQILGTFVLAVFGLLAALILYGIFVAVDSWFMPYSPSSGTVVSRDHTPGHFQTTYIINGNGGMTPIITWIPESWSIRVKIPEGTDSESVSENDFNRMPPGTPVRVIFQKGRISGRIYIDNPQPKP